MKLSRQNFIKLRMGYPLLVLAGSREPTLSYSMIFRDLRKLVSIVSL
jgi:hypothetical protein